MPPPPERPVQLALSVRESATLLAALRFWAEDILPHAPAIARPYLPTRFRQMPLLSATDVRRLSRRIAARLQRCTDRLP